MSKKILGITLAGLGIAGSFAGGMVLSNNLKDDNYSIVVAEKESEITSISETLDNLDKQISEKDAEIALLKSTKEDLQTKYNSLVEKNSATETELASLKTRYDELVASNTATEKELNDLQTQYDTLLETSKSDKAEIERLKTNIQELETNITSLETQLTTVQNNYSSLQQEYNSLKTQYDALRSQSEVDKNEISSLNATITNLNNRITDLESQVEQLEEKLKDDNSLFQSLEKGTQYSFLRISDDRILVIGRNNNLDQLYSYSVLNGFKLVAESSSLSSKNFHIEFSSDYYHVLDNCDVVFAERGLSSKGFYVYKYETDEFIHPVDKGYSLTKLYKLSNGNYLISGSSSYSEFSYIFDSNYSILATLSYKNLQIVSTNGDVVILKGSHGGEGGTSVILMLNLSTNAVEELEGENFNVQITSQAEYNFALSNGDFLLSTCGSGGIYLIDVSAKTFSLLTSEIYNCTTYFESSTGKVFCAADNSYGLWVYDIQTKEIKQISVYSGFKYFEEDDNGVTVAYSASASTKYYYDYATGTFSKLE